MTIQHSTDFFTTAYEQFKNHFESNSIFSISNLLWQLIVNEVHSDKITCFHPVDSKDEPEYFEIGIIAFNEGGYNKSHVTFLKGTDYDKACDICDQMNEFLFGMTPELCNKIISQSMAKAIS
jgi:hypothetical protein